jgi:hypothetical protein
LLARILDRIEGVFQFGTSEHKIGLAQNLHARYVSYRAEDVFTHMMLLASCASREAAGILEAALIYIVHKQGRTMWNRNFVNRDRGGTGRRPPGTAFTQTHVYLVVRTVDPTAERPRMAGERRKRARPA